MRKETENWWKQAQDDLKTAGDSMKSGNYYACVFWCQQAVEKALKAAYLIVKKTHASSTHSLVFLASQTGVGRKFFPFLQELTPVYINTRYPTADTTPSEIYGEEKANELLSKTEEFLKWLEKDILTGKH